MMKRLFAFGFVFLSVFCLSQMVYAQGEPQHDYAQLKYGIFVHYGWGNVPGAGSGYPITQYPDGSYPTSVDEVANNFDVQGFANDMADAKVQYVIFTAWHGGMYPLFPSEAMEDWLGPGHASQRDLIGEVLDALHAKGIKVYLYTQPEEAHNFSASEKAAVGFINSSTYSQTFNDFINDVYGEMVERYGTRIDGFWFDGGLQSNAVDRVRLRNTILAEVPNAVMIANRFANEAGDFGAKEVHRPGSTTGFASDYTGVSNSDEGTWPSYLRSVAFLADTAWWSTPGSVRHSGTQMYKYTVLEAGSNLEGGGVAWAFGPYPGSTISWNTGVKSAFVDLGNKIDAVAESIKNTYPSTSWPTAAGTRIDDLTWGVATRSVDDQYEYLHVLVPPTSGNTITLPATADGKKFASAVNLRTGNPATIVQRANSVEITLHGNDTWDSLDTVIKLTVDSGYVERRNVALGKTVTTSSQSVGGEGSNVVDDDTTTKWYSPGGHPSWLMVDLGENPYLISKFVVKHAGVNENGIYNTNQFQIQVSDSPNGPWTTLTDTAIYPESYGTGNAQNVTSYEAGLSPGFNAPVIKRYVRLYVQTASLTTDNHARIYEFQIWGSPVNLALNKTTSVSNYYQNNPDYLGSKAVDEDWTTRWATDDGISSAWLEVDFGATTTFNKVYLREYGDRVTSYKIQYWNGNSWLDAYTGTSIGASRTVSFPNVTGSKARLYINSVSGTKGPTIYEFAPYLDE